MNQSYPTFPTNPQYSQAPQMAYPNAQNMQSHGPGAMMMPQDLASIQQQGYMQQQQQLAQAQAQMMARGYASSSSSTPAHKKKKPVGFAFPCPSCPFKLRSCVAKAVTSGPDDAPTHPTPRPTPFVRTLPETRDVRAGGYRALGGRAR